MDADRRFVNCRSTARTVSLHAVRRPRSGATFDRRSDSTTTSGSSTPCSEGGRRQRGPLRRVVRRLHRAALRRDAPGPCDRAHPRVGARARLEPDRASAVVPRAPVAVGPRFCRDRTDAAVAGDCAAAYDTWPARLAFIGAPRRAASLRTDDSAAHGGRVTTPAGHSTSRPTARVSRVPTLVVTGEDALDRVVPAAVTRRYLDLIPGAQYSRWRGPGISAWSRGRSSLPTSSCRFIACTPDQNLTHAIPD